MDKDLKEANKKKKGFLCEKCKRVFKTKGGLSLHISKRQTPCGQEYKCFNCDFKTFDCNKIFWHSQNGWCLPKYKPR